MDTISHALIGIGVAGLSGQPVALNDPVYLAALIGSQAPDLKAAAQKTELGQFFSAFTPFSYFKEFKEQKEAIDKRKIIHIFDLRYFSERGFAYCGAIIFGENGLPCDSYIYTYKQKIKIGV